MINNPENNILAVQPINKLIAKFAVPSIISMLVGSVYNMLDQVFIGHGVEDIAMGATTVAFPVVTICMAWALLCGVGGASSFNLESGRGEHSRARHSVGSALFLLAAGGVMIMAVVLVFLRPILRFCGATGELMEYSVTYAGITALGLPFLAISTGGAHLIRADKSPKFSMAMLISGAVLNTLLDIVFIFVLDWGIAGAAWSTVIGEGLSAVLVVIYFLKRQRMHLKWRDLLPVWRRCTRIFSLGSAASVNQIAIFVVQILMNNQLARYGAQSAYGAEIAVTVAGVIGKVAMLYLGICIGISQGCQPIWGFNYGAGQFDRVKATYKKAAVLCLGVGTACFILFQLFPGQIITLFGMHNEAGIAFAVRYFRVFLLLTFINGLQPMSSGFFTSIGKAKLGIITSLTRQIAFLVPLVILLPLQFGMDGILYAGPIADAAAAVIAIVLALRHLRKMHA